MYGLKSIFLCLITISSYYFCCRCHKSQLCDLQSHDLLDLVVQRDSDRTKIGEKFFAKWKEPDDSGQFVPNYFWWGSIK